jgi:hypothetical protein
MRDTLHASLLQPASMQDNRNIATAFPANMAECFSYQYGAECFSYEERRKHPNSQACVWQTCFHRTAILPIAPHGTSCEKPPSLAGVARQKITGRNGRRSGVTFIK